MNMTQSVATERNGGWTEPKPGAASLAAGMITKGTSKHSEKELADELETYAIALNGSASLDASMISAGCLLEHLPRETTGPDVETPRSCELRCLACNLDAMNPVMSLSLEQKEPVCRADFDQGP